MKWESLPPLFVAETGGAAYGGYILGKHDIGRRGEEGYHSGGTRLVLMIVCIVSTRVVYDWLAYIVMAFLRKSGRVSSVQVAERISCRGLLSFGVLLPLTSRTARRLDLSVDILLCRYSKRRRWCRFTPRCNRCRDTRSAPRGLR